MPIFINKVRLDSFNNRITLPLLKLLKLRHYLITNFKLSEFFLFKDTAFKFRKILIVVKKLLHSPYILLILGCYPLIAYIAIIWLQKILFFTRFSTGTGN